MAAMLEKLMSGHRSGTRPFVLFVVSQNHSNVFCSSVSRNGSTATADRAGVTPGWVARVPQARSSATARTGTNGRGTRIALPSALALVLLARAAPERRRHRAGRVEHIPQPGPHRSHPVPV